MTGRTTLSLARERGCEPCRERVIEATRGHDGVMTVERVGGAVTVAFDAERCSLEDITASAELARLRNAEQFEHHEVRITGMDCADCAMRVQAAVTRAPSVSAVDVNLTAEQLRVEVAAGAGLAEVRRVVEGLGYGLQATRPSREGGPAEAETETVDVGRRRPLREWMAGSDRVTAIAAALMLVAGVADLAGGLREAVVAGYALSVVVGGLAIARSGIRGAIATRSPDMNLLMTIAVVGAAAIGAWTEAALVVVLFSVGEMLERRAVGRARNQLASLISLTPPTARVLRDHVHADGRRHDQELEIPVEELELGERLVVKPGERIPADGVIEAGVTAVDQAAITGESVPVDRAPGDVVFAGTLNGQGRIEVRVTSAAGDSTVDRIARLVREAQAQRSPSERWVTAFARRYTPAVVLLALAVTLVLPLSGLESWSTGVYSGLALLILACPCALVLSTPVTIVSALGRASSAGVLVKGGEFLERAARIDTVAFDKTGTLTQGRPRVVAVESCSTRWSDDEVLVLAAAVETGSEHPLAAAIVRGAEGRGIEIRPAFEVTAHVGLGATGTTHQGTVTVADARMFDDLEPAVEQALAAQRSQGRTAVVVAVGADQVGVIALADAPRPEAREAIADLRRLGITEFAMLSGDNESAASAIAAEVGITTVHAALLPGAKQELVGAMPGTVAMVGDGINDAPALARAALGVAMGTGGSDTAIEVADIALIGDDPRKLAGLIGLARWTRAVVRQNIAFSLGTKVVAAVLLAFGLLPLWGAVATDVGASLIVVANGLRVARTRPLVGRSGPLLGADAGSSRREPSAAEPACADDCCSHHGQ